MSTTHDGQTNPRDGSDLSQIHVPDTDHNRVHMVYEKPFHRNDTSFGFVLLNIITVFQQKKCALFFIIEIQHNAIFVHSRCSLGIKPSFSRVLRLIKTQLFVG